MKYQYRLGCLMAVLTAVVLIGGCKEGKNTKADTKEYKSYTMAEVMLIAATEKNRYEEVYTSDVWQIKLGDDGVTFEEYLKGQIENFLNELMTMNLLAQEQEITLTGTEQETLRELSEAYMNGLTSDDIKYMKITEDDVLKMYREYYTANKLVSELTKDMDLEVSDNEAKVITVDVIKLNDKETADAVYEKVTAESANFESIAKADSVDTIVRKQLNREDVSQSLEDVVFSLEEGEISQVTEADGACYIFKSVSAYDADATKERKKKLTSDKKNLAFRQIYDQFLEKNPISFDHDVWNHISFTGDNEATTTNFFNLYREYIPN